MTIHEALMGAYVVGWNDAHSGAVYDDHKREVAEDLAAQITSIQSELAEALRDLLDVSNCLDKSDVGGRGPVEAPDECCGCRVCEAARGALEALAKAGVR